MLKKRRHGFLPPGNTREGARFSCIINGLWLLLIEFRNCEANNQASKQAGESRYFSPTSQRLVEVRSEFCRLSMVTR
ncbi:hypothetical protein [Thiolapillus brandeum]|uniref:hypothetical protein n=1 Tax=Thiolapillus brandeum TaxID=1076588 RepID=UPI0011852802|nr:hypothetical protein [Thiolapillus brandeum]